MRRLNIILAVEAASKALPDGGILLVENVRFYSEEEANADGFSQGLAKLGDVYVNDGFGAAHRAHASTAGIAKYLRIGDWDRKSEHMLVGN